MAVAAGARAARGGEESSQGAARHAVSWTLAAIVVLGAALRFSTLGEQSFWYDEAVTHSIVAHGLSHVLRAVPQTESTPPLFYLLAWAWTRVFGVGEVGLRSFSALCGTALIPVMWLIGCRLVSARVGLIAALLTAVNPFLFYYSQEARSYALLTLLSAASLLALLRAVEIPSRRRLLFWGLLAAAALAVHYFAAFIVLPEGVWLLLVLRRRRSLSRARALSLLGPPALVVIPLALLAIHQNDGRAGYIAGSGSLPYRLAQLGKQDLIGDGQPHKLLLAGIGTLVVLFAGVRLARLASGREGAAAALPAALGVVGITLAVAVSALGTDYLNSRNLLPTWPPLALAVAVGLGVDRARSAGLIGTAILSVLSLLCILTVVFNTDYQRDDWRGAARALGPLTGPRAIVSDRFDSRVPLSVYLSGIADLPASGVGVREVDVIWLSRRLGDPVAVFTPRPLAGFSVTLLRRRQFVIASYHAAGGSAVPAPPPALAALYPDPTRSLVLLQR